LKKQKLGELGYRWYEDYLSSPHWASIRRRFLASSCCAPGCSSTRRLQLHHVSYARLGAEEAGDVRTLCEPCHRLLHRLAGSLDPAVALRNADELRVLRGGSCMVAVCRLMLSQPQREFYGREVASETDVPKAHITGIYKSLKQLEQLGYATLRFTPSPITGPTCRSYRLTSEGLEIARKVVALAA
jgi:hypothetical protein